MPPDSRDFLFMSSLFGGEMARPVGDFTRLTSLIPVNTVAPVISGTVEVGQTLSCTTGTWAYVPISYLYQWRRNDAAIPSATNSTYLLVEADAGQDITCAVTAVNPSGLSDPAISNTLEIEEDTPVNTVAPVISGTAEVGQTLSCTTGTWTNSPDSYTYQWKRDGANLAATASTYVLVALDEGTTITCAVTATNEVGSNTAISNPLIVSEEGAGGTIQLTASTVAENATIGALIGVLSVSGGSGTYTFTITIDADSKFQVDDDELQTAALLDYDTATSHSVTISADNGVDDEILQAFTITVTDVGTIAGLTDFAWASTAADDIPDFSFDLPVGAAAGDVIRVRHSGTTTYFTHTLTAANITDDTFTVLGISALTEGVYSFDARREVGAQSSAYTSPAISVTINPAPELAAVDPLSPADGVAGVDVLTDLVITFDKDIEFGAGTIDIFKTDDTLFESFDVISDAGGKLVIVDDTLTINPAGTLAGSTGYYVQIDATAIQNTSGILFAGITNETDWTFTTAAAANEMMVATFFSDNTWTAPADIVGPIILKGEVLAAGGASATASGSGGGGAYSRCENTTVVPSRTYTIQVGEGATATNGEDSFIQDSISLTYLAVAQGGRSDGNGRAGGAAASGTGDVKWSGGNGLASAGVAASGPAAGDSASGANSPTTAGGQRTGAGNATSGVGFAWGGGGRSTGSVSGAGGKGMARIHYQVPRTANYPYSVGREWGRDAAVLTSRNVLLPAGIEPGDLIIVGCGDAHASSITLSITGFTSLDTETQSTTLSTAILYKVAAGTEGGTNVVLASSGAASAVSWLVNVIRNGGTPLSSSTNGSATTSNPPAQTGGSAGNYLILAFSISLGSGFGTSPPTGHSLSGYSNIILQPTSNVGGAHCFMAEKRFTYSGSAEDPGTITLAGSAVGWTAYTVAIPYSA